LGVLERAAKGPMVRVSSDGALCKIETDRDEQTTKRARRNSPDPLFLALSLNRPL